jgi:hypothetical protein
MCTSTQSAAAASAPRDKQQESAVPTSTQSASTPIPVTADNFPRAESDLYFANVVTRDGFGKYMHNRQPTPIEQQDVIRMNRDTLYSAAVFDLDAGPVTITLPDAGKRFMSMQVIDEDEYTHMVVYGKGSYRLAREEVGTRYVIAAIRTLVNPDDPADLDQVHKLQDSITVSQKNRGAFEIPQWDKESQDKVRGALLTLGATIPNLKHAFGAKGEVDPVRYLIGAAAGWGGNPDKDAVYLNFTPKNNDGTGVYRLTVKDVPVDGFWSITVYNAQGYFQKNPYNAYSLNNITAKKNPDGSVTVQFGGADGKTPNCLPIMQGWNYLVRLYRPRAEILDGTYKFPEPQGVQ